MDKNELRELLAEEMSVYGITSGNIAEKRFRHSKKYMIWRAVKRFRKYEYLCSKRDASRGFISTHWNALRVKIADRKYNKAAEKVGVELTPGMIGKNIRICHNNVVLFGNVGDNCVFHGNNVVGNKKTGMSSAVPRIGNNVDVGFGAIIIGEVEISDGCVIGAGAVVTRSFTTPGSVIVGVPAREI